MKLTYFLKLLSVVLILALMATLTILVAYSPSETAAAESVGVGEVTANPGDGAARPPQQQPTGDGIWQDVDQVGIQSQGQRDIIPTKFRLVAANINALDGALAQAPMEGQGTPAVLTLPMPDGTFQRFQVQAYAMMEPGLAAKYPNIKNYLGQGLDDPTATIRLDRTPAGFHGMIISADSTVYIDPYSRGDITHYMSYYTRDFSAEGKVGERLPPLPGPSRIDSQDISAAASSGPTLRTYRLAVAATGEYTTFHGGTVPQALAAINTTINRVNGIYYREFSAQMTLVANNDQVIYTNAATDPYLNTSGDLTNNQNNLNAVIGNANYDIGHLVGTGGGGIATLRSLCNTNTKGRGLTGSPAPVGDPFDVDFVAHEIGHQYGGNHTYNADGAGNCTTGVSSVAYEPGSGTTIMAYAGICTNQNIQSHSDDYFHGASFDEIMAHLTDTTATPGIEGGDSCANKTATGNVAPIVDAGLNYTIPMSTPFILTGSATDATIGGSLTYDWEQFELGTVWNAAANPFLPNNDIGASRPIFRSYSPVTLAYRNFPVMANILDNTFSNKGEVLPVRARTIPFRLTVRDNLGGVANDTMNVTVSTASGPFRVTAPTGTEVWAPGSNQTVTWNKAGTDGAPVSCANVDILMSTDGGQTFPITVLANTPNDGSQNVTMPDNPAINAIIKVQCSNNIFFDAASIAVCTPLFQDTHEDGFGDWTTSQGSGTNPWVGKTNGGFSGSNYWNVPNAAAKTFADSYLTSQTVAATSDSLVLRVNHKYAFQNFSNNRNDGGVIEINIDGGGFNDVGAANFTQNGYNALASAPSSGGALQGRQIFGGDSGGYVASVVKLNGVSTGNNIQIRFRMATDGWISGADYAGWSVDDVLICDLPQTATAAYLPIIVKN